MLRLSPSAQRGLIGWGFVGITAVAVYWSFFSEGMPILWGPSASASEVAQGRELFEHEWTANDPLAHGDGLGPVFNAKSCASCHFQGGLGGGGNLEHNAVGFEIHGRREDPRFHTGTIHNFSIDPAFKESEDQLQKLYPVIPGRTIPSSSGCGGPTVIPDFNPVHTQTVQATALFGAGWVDKITDKAILRNERARGVRNATNEMKLEFQNVPVGRARTVKGGIGKFGWKAQFATLEEFVAAACANELGLGTPYSEQAKPLGNPNHSAETDLDKKQFQALVSFVKTLPKPVEESSGDPGAEYGKKVFHSTGCAVCHVPDMGGVKGVYTDFLLYSLEDPQPQGGRGSYGDPSPLLGLPDRPEGEPKPNEWKTPALWGVADSAPYLHDGSAATLPDAIEAHKGDAKIVYEKYKVLSAEDRAALILFLRTLKAPPTAMPLRDPGITKLK